MVDPEAVHETFPNVPFWAIRVLLGMDCLRAQQLVLPEILEYLGSSMPVSAISVSPIFLMPICAPLIFLKGMRTMGTSKALI